MTHLTAGIAGLSMTELLMVLLVVVLLFGSTKIPQLMRGLGQGINEFKKGMKDGAPDENAPKDAAPKDAPPPK